MTGTVKIPLYGISRQYLNLREEILTETDRVLQTGALIDGLEHMAFRNSMRKRTLRGHATAVHSGTEALIFALRALRNKTTIDYPRVLIPAVSFVATVNSVYEAGCIPVFCDVTEDGLMDLNTVPDPKVIDFIMYVNLYGNIIDFDKLQLVNQFFGRDVPVVEDAAQSFGAAYKGRPSGSLGTISCLSFDPTKNLANYGNGGMILTDDDELHNDVVNMQNNGKRSYHCETGTNSRMSEADCAQMKVKLKYFDTWQARRKEIAEFYDSQLSGVVRTTKYDSSVSPAYSKYVIHATRRADLRSHLYDLGIETKVTYSQTLPSLNLISGAIELDYPMSVRHCKTCLSLPIYPELTDAEVEVVASAVQSFFLK